MHALINALPDPNYATLRALVLHLHRVQQSSEINRMSTANLGICWAYVLIQSFVVLTNLLQSVNHGSPQRQ
jgi:hypothetical protein